MTAISGRMLSVNIGCGSLGTSWGKMEEMLLIWRTAGPSHTEIFGSDNQTQLQTAVWGDQVRNIFTFFCHNIHISQSMGRPSSRRIAIYLGTDGAQCKRTLMTKHLKLTSLYLIRWLTCSEAPSFLLRHITAPTACRARSIANWASSDPRPAPQSR